MVQRTIEIKKSAIKNIFKVSAFIESKGLPQTAKQFSHEVYDAIIKLGNPIVRHSYCRDIKRRAKELKCISFKKNT